MLSGFFARVSRESLVQFGRYATIGVFNTVLNAAIFNALIFASGISRGYEVTLFAFVTFSIVITQSFFWNKYWTFGDSARENRARQYAKFFLVSGVIGALNIGIINILVNVVGAPHGISEIVWANIALLCTVAVAVFGNFFGYKFFVFSE